MYKENLLILFCSAICALGCTPKDNKETPKDFSCIQIFDANGQALGTHGDCPAGSDDWGAFALDAAEQALLLFSDTVGLAGTAASGIKNVFCFPIPVRIGDPLYLTVRSDVSGQPVKVKIAIADESLKAVKQYALRTATNSTFAVQISPDDFQTGQYYRVYYRASAAGNENLFEGHGNFLVCKTFISNGLTIEMDCK